MTDQQIQTIAKAWVKELRYGSTKSGKTKNVCESYPDPLLILNFEAGGFGSIQNRNYEVIKPELLPHRHQAIKDISMTQSPITIADFTANIGKVSLTASKIKKQDLALSFINVLNSLHDDCPYETVVIDSLNPLCETVMEFVLALNGKTAPEFQHWGMYGMKVKEIVGSFLALPANCILLAHDESETNQITHESSIQIRAAGKIVQADVPTMFNNVLYSTVITDPKQGLQYKVLTKPKGFVKRIGCRTANLPPICGPRYEDIYGEIK